MKEINQNILPSATQISEKKQKKKEMNVQSQKQPQYNIREYFAKKKKKNYEKDSDKQRFN